ncbi:MAG: hypothetical protein WAM47_11675 [Candidatus Sulfotelmatobacter sp.]
MKKKRKQRRKYSPKIASIRLLGAVDDWVNANGGNALVAGSIGLLDHPSMGIFSEGLDSLSFYVVMKVTGKRPVKEESKVILGRDPEPSQQKRR